MYTATMRYHFKEAFFSEACAIWEKEIIDQAKKHQGFVRMQFLTAKPKALAIGTWKDKKYAENFMQSGAFKQLMQKIKGMLQEEPRPEIWNLLYFEEA